MLETPHVLVGAAIAAKVQNPLLAIPLAFTSHFLLEGVPHWNPHLNTETKKHGKITKSSTMLVAGDATIALASGIFIASRFLPNYALAATILFSCLASVLPDVIEAPYYFLHIRSKWAVNWIKFQKTLQNDTSPLPGILTQLVTIGAALAWIFS